MPANPSTPEVTRADIQAAGDHLGLRQLDDGRYLYPNGRYRARHNALSETLARHRIAHSPARGGDELREAARGVLERWDGASPNSMVELMDALRKALASTDMAGAGEGMSRSEAQDFADFYDLPQNAVASLAAPPVEGLTSGEGRLDRLAARIYAILACEDDDTPHVQAAMRGDPNARAGDLPMTARRIAMLAERHFASPKATATASVRDVKPQDVYREIRAAWFDGRETAGKQYDSEAVEAKWERQVARALTDSGTADTHAGSGVTGGHADTEGEAMAMFAHLNCPLCAGSGHVEDAEALGSLIVALLISLDDIELPDGSGQMGMPASVEDAAGNLAEAIQWDGTKPAAIHPVDSRAQGGEK